MNNLETILTVINVVLCLYILFLYYCILSMEKSSKAKSKVINELLFVCEYRSKMIKDLMNYESNNNQLTDTNSNKTVK